jgi:alpha-methylacyl-CoA racemase
LNRGKASIAIDLKQQAGVETLLRLVEGADALIEVFRPGVAERLGIGPADCHARNPDLIYGRMTGFGQQGPWAARAGHDIDYIALAGALEPLGRAGQPPTPPINVLGDFAGGGMLIAFGVACAAYARTTRPALGEGGSAGDGRGQAGRARGERSQAGRAQGERSQAGRGQVVDAAMIDGAALMLTPFYLARSRGTWGPRGTNELDTGAHYYDAYETSDGRWVAVGAVEPQFYAELLRRLDVAADPDLAGSQSDQSAWPRRKEKLAAVFRQRTRDEWCQIMEGSDACFAPVLDPVEAPGHPHHRARATFIDIGGVVQPAPAPRFSATPPARPEAPTHPGADTDAVLGAAGFTDEEIAGLRAGKAIA